MRARAESGEFQFQAIPFIAMPRHDAGGLILGCPNGCEVFTLIGVYLFHPNHLEFGSCFLDSWASGSSGVIEKLHIKLLNHLLTY